MSSVYDGYDTYDDDENDDDDLYDDCGDNGTFDDIWQLRLLWLWWW